jgi:hypothetical protein
MQDDYTKVHIKKTDIADKSKEIPGATLTIYTVDENGEKERFTTHG